MLAPCACMADSFQPLGPARRLHLASTGESRFPSFPCHKRNPSASSSQLCHDKPLGRITAADVSLVMVSRIVHKAMSFPVPSGPWLNSGEASKNHAFLLLASPRRRRRAVACSTGPQIEGTHPTSRQARDFPWQTQQGPPWSRE